MCGHVGVAGEVNWKVEKVFRTLLRLDVIRGEDSTGIAAMSLTGAVKIAKEATNAYDFLSTNKDSAEIFKGFHRALMGHNRAATKGKVVNENAHPFEFGDIVGAHNGTLKRYNNLLDGNKFKVDSQAVFYHMSEESTEDLWKNLDGAAALVWMNKKEKTLNFLRNKERELWYTITTDGNTFMWASEPWMLMVACAREGLDIEKPVIFKTDVHYTIEPCTKNFNMKVRELEAYKFVYTPPTVTYHQSTVLQKIPSEKAFTLHSGKTIKFEIDVIRDMNAGTSLHRSNVFGVTDDGIAVRIWGIDSYKYEWILEIMAQEDIQFEGKIVNKTDYSIEVDMSTVIPLYDFTKCKCHVCGDEITEGTGVEQASGNIFCAECNADLIALGQEGYV